MIKIHIFSNRDFGELTGIKQIDADKFAVIFYKLFYNIIVIEFNFDKNNLLQIIFLKQNLCE